MALCLMGMAVTAQSLEQPEKIKVYCEVMCVQYNLFNGWIYNSENNKKFSFASPMSVFAYMAKRGWEYKDAIIVTESAGLTGKSNVWHFILTKEMPANYTQEDIIGDIDYRNK